MFYGKCAYFATIMFLAVISSSTSVNAMTDGNDAKPVAKSERILRFDTVVMGHREVIVEITLPDGGKVTRVTEPVSGRDGKEGGARVLKGYSLPDGTLVEKEIRRNTDGTVSVLDVDNNASRPNRHEKRMTEKEFVDWVKAQQTK